MFLIGWLIFLVAAVIVGTVCAIKIQSYRHSKYFCARGVPYISEVNWRIFQFLQGKLSIAEMELLLYKDTMNRGGKFAGFSDNFMQPAYYIADMDLMRHIYVKDFEHFVDRRKLSTQHSNMFLKRMLISMESDRWKGLRSKLSPTFTSGKIKRMFNIFDNSSRRMCDYMKKAIPPNGEFDITEAYSKYAMDVIASCAFGIDSKSFACAPGVLSEFEEMGQRFQLKFKPSVFLKFIVILVLPKLADFFGLQAMDTVPQDYFEKVVKEVMKRRRSTGERTDDFLQLMMDTQEGLLKADESTKETLEVMSGSDEGKNVFDGTSEKFKFEDDDIIANCILFFLGGYDTSLSLLTYCAYQLALEQTVQQKLYDEVKRFMEKNDNTLTYEAVLEMNYLDMFINETLRFFPPAVRTERTCTNDYKIPGTDVVIEKGTVICMPVLPLHRDPKNYENPEMFDPERFLPHRKNDRHPYAFVPFGHGPRNCIGMRFALIQVKAVVATLVYNFKLEPCSKTDIPMKFANTPTLKPLNGMWLNFSCRNSE